MQFRDHEAVNGKRDFYPIDPRQIKIDTGYNVRDLNSVGSLEHIENLKNSIIANGVRVPLEVRLDGENIYVVAGHCRHAAVMSAIAEGHEIKTIPCIPEPKGTNEVERTLNLVVSNSGAPLAPIEIAHVVKRLSDFGWSHIDISKRIGWKSQQSVTMHLEMLEMPHAVQGMVRDGQVSATMALEEVKKNGTEAVGILQTAIVTAKSEGKTRATKKHMPSAKPGKKALLAAMEPFYLLWSEQYYDKGPADQVIEIKRSLLDALALAYETEVN